MAVIVFAGIWSLFGEKIESEVRSEQGCPHSNALPSETNQDEGRAAVLCLLNKERAKRGLPALAEDGQLEIAAQKHAEDMGQRNFFAHRNPDGLSPQHRISAAGFRGRTTGENILWAGGGHPASPAGAVDSWMHSPGHKANILRTSFTRVGTGIAYDPPRAVARGGHVGVYVNNFGG